MTGTLGGTCDEWSPGRMARWGDHTAGVKDRIECRSHGCREAHRQVSYQAEDSSKVWVKPEGELLDKELKLHGRKGPL